VRSLALLAVLALSVPAIPAASAGENPFNKSKTPFSKEPAAAPPARPAPPKPAPTPAPAPTRPGARGRGSFKVTYSAVADKDLREIQKIFRETGLLEDTAKELNGIFLLPTDVTITMAECGEANAYYEADAKKVTLCYELISQLSTMFLAEAESDQEQEEAGEAIGGAAMFTLFHELGHALIDLYDLPITGREEDAVDQLATIILLEGGDEGEAAAVNGATSFLDEESDEDQEELAEISYWDEHSLGEQRFYNILCWTYGKNPAGNEDLVTDGTLPKERAERCPEEYERMSKSWDLLLTPHMKE
jgi:hypothetical protein